MTAWLTDIGYSRSQVGLLGIVFMPYAINFLWAPLIDHLKLPGLTRYGHRRSWTLLCLMLLIALTLVLAVTGPSINLLITGFLCLFIAAVSATQDLAIDAYRITVIREDEPELVGHAAAMATCGWWTGFSLPGVFAFTLADQVGWPMVYVGLSVALAAILVAVFAFVKEPPSPKTKQGDIKFSRIPLFDQSYVAGIAEFFQRNGVKLALSLLAFVFLFKLGEAFLGRMVIVFYKEVGFTNADIGVYSQGLGLFITITCAIAAGFFTSKFGTIRGLLLAGVAMASTNLLFAVLAVIGPDKTMLVFALVADGITSAFSTVAFVAFISHFASHLHAAFHYGALASLGNLGRTLLAATSGILVDALSGDWAMFFVLTALMVLPSLLFLLWINRQVPIKANED